MVLPTQFNVNPILLFFPVREELPVSISIHSSRRDRQQAYSPIWIWGISPRQKEKEEQGEDPLVHAGEFLRGSAMNANFKS